MDEFIKFAQALALLSASALCIYLIVVLVRLRVVLESIRRDIADLTRSLKPVLENLTIVTEKAKSIVSKIEDQVRLLHTSFDALRQIVDNVLEFEERIQERLETPFLRAASLFTGLVAKLAGYLGLSGQRAD